MNSIVCPTQKDPIHVEKLNLFQMSLRKHELQSHGPKQAVFTARPVLYRRSVERVAGQN